MFQGKVCIRRNTLCISRIQKRRLGAKDPQPRRKAVSRASPIKRERGEFYIHPAVAPVSLLRDYSVCDFTHGPAHLGGQNLAALSTTAGQNLAAVGSSHSLTETVNLGTMTTAGLVGTLHYIFTSCGWFVSYARQSVQTAATHIQGPYMVTLGHYNRKRQ